MTHSDSMKFIYDLQSPQIKPSTYDLGWGEDDSVNIRMPTQLATCGKYAACQERHCHERVVFCSCVTGSDQDTWQLGPSF